MDIQIKNEQEAINTCEQILSYTQIAAAHIESLESALQKINAAWESTGADKQSYVAELEKQINNLRIMEKNMNDVASVVLKHAQDIKAIGSSTM